MPRSTRTDSKYYRIYAVSRQPDGRLDQIICYQGAEYDQIIDKAAAATTVSAVHVDEVQIIKLDAGGDSRLYFRDLFGQEWFAGRLTCAASAASQTDVGVVEAFLQNIPNGAIEGVTVTVGTAGSKVAWETPASRAIAGAAARCVWEVTFTHNPGAQNLLRCTDKDNDALALLSGSGSTDLSFNTYHNTESGFGDSCDTTTEHYHTMAASSTVISGLLPGDRFRVEGSQWNDGWFTVGTIKSSATVVHVIEPVVDEAAGANILIHMPATRCNVYKQTVGTKESLACSGRGLCDGGSGTCQCFRGSTGDDCSQQSAISM